MEVCNRRALSAGMAILMLISFATSTTMVAQPLFEVESMNLNVYRDGLVHVTQTLIVEELAPEVMLPLLSASVENLLVLDQSQLAIDYEINGGNLTIFTLGAERVLIEYDTVMLTKKEAEVWTLIADNPYTLMVFLPSNATVIYLNKMPTAIDTSTSRIKLSLYPGEWEISYVLPLVPEETGTEDNGAILTPFPIEYVIATTVIMILVFLLVILIITRRRKPNIDKTMKAYPQLKKEDKEVIEFLAERGGKAFEAEIRERFPDMPRTSLWRLVRRLERLDIVEVKKIGLENQVLLR